MNGWMDGMNEWMDGECIGLFVVVVFGCAYCYVSCLCKMLSNLMLLRIRMICEAIVRYDIVRYVCYSMI